MKKANAAKEKSNLQLRISRTEGRSAAIVSRLEKAATKTGLSINDIANLAVAAGLNIVENKLGEIQEPAVAA